MQAPLLNNLLANVLAAPQLGALNSLVGVQPGAGLSLEGKGFAAQLAQALAALSAGGDTVAKQPQGEGLAALMAALRQALEAAGDATSGQGLCPLLGRLLAEGGEGCPQPGALKSGSENEAAQLDGLLEVAVLLAAQAAPAAPSEAAPAPEAAVPEGIASVGPRSASGATWLPAPAEEGAADVHETPDTKPVLDGLKRLFEAVAGAGDQPAAQDAKSAVQALPSEAAGVSAAVNPELQDAPQPDPLGLKVARAVQEAIQAVKAAESSGPAGLAVAQAVPEVLRANQGATDGQGRPGRSEALSAKAQAKSQIITFEAPAQEGQAQVAAPSAEPDRPFLFRERFQAAVQAAQGQAGGESVEPTGQRPEREISPETLEPRLAAAQADQLAGGSVAGEKSEASPELVRQVAHQVARAVRGGLNRGEERVRLRLSPPELGEVRLDLKLHGANLKVILVAETQMAREALQASIPELRISLAEQGLRLEEFGVFVRQDGAEGFAFLGREQAGQQQAEAQAEPGPQVQGGAEPEAGAIHTLGPAGRINLFC